MTCMLKPQYSYHWFKTLSTQFYELKLVSLFDISSKLQRTAIMTSTAEQGDLSAYEQRRIDNIKRNNARLRALGLISAIEERRSNDIACGISVDEKSKKNDDDANESSGPESSDDGEGDGADQGTAKRKRKSRVIEPREGSRKSRRLKGENAEFDDGAILSRSPISIKEEREARVQECREVRLRAANAIAACGGEEAAKKNPTATYEHCLMRVKTMTDKALANRVKAIERAAGKHCVVKMAIFKSCLQDEGMWELAEVTSEALERLKALKPIPEE